MIGDELLRGEKVRLCAWTKDDIPVVTGWYQSVEFMRLFDTIPARPRTAEYVAQWMDEAEKSPNVFSFGVRIVDGGKLIGLVEVEDILWAHGVGSLSVGIGDPAYRGGGYGSEAIALVLRFAFHEINLHRVQLNVYRYNERAIAAYEKLGFVREGVLREFLNRDGQRHDVFVYGLLRREWEAQQGGNGN